MAQFSKQWCESVNTSMPHDFDIDDIVKDLYSDRYYPIVCEGFKFNCIHKDTHDNVWLSFGHDKNGNSNSWRRYKSVIVEHKKTNKK